MKRLLFFLLVLVTQLADAQITEQFIGAPNVRVRSRGQFVSDSGSIISSLHDTSGTANLTGMLLLKSGYPVWYTGNLWRIVASTYYVDSVITSKSIGALPYQRVPFGSIGNTMTSSTQFTWDSIFNVLNVGNAASSSNGSIVVGGSGTGIGRVTGGGGALIVEGGDLTVQSNPTHFINFKTNTIERMRILNGGNVGIGITNPVSALDVVGTTRSTSFQVTGQTTFTGNPAGISLYARPLTVAQNTFSAGIIEYSFPIPAAGWRGYLGVQSWAYLFGSTPQQPAQVAGKFPNYMVAFSGGQVYDNDNTTISTLLGTFSGLNNQHGTVNNAYDFYASELNSISATSNNDSVLNHYGLYMEPFNYAVGGTQNFGVYVNGTQKNYLGGKTSIGTTDTTHQLMVRYSIGADNLYARKYVRAGDTTYRFSPTKYGYFFGNSITAGSAITPYYFRWATMVANGMNVQEVNYGIGGTRLVMQSVGDSSMEERIFLIPVYNSATDDGLFFAYGTNDAVTLAIDTATFRSVYNRIIDTAIIARGWPASKIFIVPTGYWLNNISILQNRGPLFANVAMSVATIKGVKTANTRQAQLNAGGLSTLNLPADSVHLNQMGNQCWAIAILDTLNYKSGDVRANGQLYARYLTIRNYGNPVGNLAVTFMDSSERLASEIRVNTNYLQGTNLESQAFGKGSLQNVAASAVSNVAFGPGALAADTSGSNNTAIGPYALTGNLSGSNNVAVGKNTLFANTTGSQSVAIGRDALRLNTTGQDNVAIGYTALTTAVSVGNLTAIGSFALNANTAGSNTGVGFSALRFNTSGTRNTAVGVNSGLINTTGSDNTAFGNRALRGTNGSFNTAFGSFAGDSITSGTDNTVAGYRAAYNLKTGTLNVVFGDQAANGLVAGSRNVVICPGSQFTVDPSNYVWIGTSNTDPRFYSIADGKTGLGLFNPTQRLHVGGQVRIDTIPNGANTDSLLDVNGGVVKRLAFTSGTYTPTITNGANVAASTAYVCQYVRIGNIVTVSGRIDIDPTLTLTSTILTITLPVASTFSASNQLGGTAACPTISNLSCAILSDGSGKAQFQMVPSDASNNAFYFSFTYQII